MVNSVFTILKIMAESPTNVLSTESRANKTKDEAPCSKDNQKKTVKNAKMITAIILSLTIGSYRKIREITMYKKAAKANKTIIY